MPSHICLFVRSSQTRKARRKMRATTVMDSTATNLPATTRRCLGSLLLLLTSFGWMIQQVESHATEVRSCLTYEGKLRIFVEHWHGSNLPVSNLPPVVMGQALIRDDNTGVVTSYTPTGYVKNVAPGNLPGCVPPGDVWERQCNSGAYNQWGYYDLQDRVTCGSDDDGTSTPAVDLTRQTMLYSTGLIFTEACGPLFPLPISRTFTDVTPPTITVNGEICDSTSTTNNNNIFTLSSQQQQDSSEEEDDDGIITVYYDKDTCDDFTSEVVTFNVGAYDECDTNPTLSLSQGSGTSFPYGTTQVTATATDNTGKISTCTFNVRVRINPNCVTPAPTSSGNPTLTPTTMPSDVPSSIPSDVPSPSPSLRPSLSFRPSIVPTVSPSWYPTTNPSSTPSLRPSAQPSTTTSPSTTPSDVPSSIPTTTPSDVPSSIPTSAPSDSVMPSSSPTTSDCSFLEPCKKPDKKGKKPPEYSMCMYDSSKDEYKDVCQSVEKLDEDIAKGDSLAKCGQCFTLGVNVIPTGETSCSTGVVESCGIKKNVAQYPMCMFDAKKGDKAPKTECQNDSDLQKDIKKGQVLVHCGSCETTNFFEGYFPIDINVVSTKKGKKVAATYTNVEEEPEDADEDDEADGDVDAGLEIGDITITAADDQEDEEDEDEGVPPVDISSCDWNSLSTCGGKKKNKKYPVCLWDTTKGEETSKCLTVSKLENYMGKGDVLLSCEGYCSDT